MTCSPHLLLGLFSLLIVAAGSGCDYNVPLATEPGRAIDERLIGRWASDKSLVRISRYDTHHYIVVLDEGVCRAWHTPVAGLDLVTLELLDGKPGTRTFLFLDYELTGGGDQLALRFISHDVIDKTITDTASARRAIETNAKHPKLLGALPQMRRVKSPDSD